jgi:hypothetical protein
VFSFNVDLKDPFGFKADSRYRQTRSDQLYQARGDNQFRNTQFRTQEEWNWRKWNDRKNTIKNIVEDARKAGVSTLAALGGTGSTIPSINIPVGQGGRVSGRYQSQTPLEMQVSLRTEAETRKENSQSNFYDAQANFLNWKARQLQTEFYTPKPLAPLPQHDPAASVIDPLYVRLQDNLSEAAKWVDQGYIPALNPDYNFELPEVTGQYYFSLPHLQRY